VVSASEPSELPEPGIKYCRPAWVKPPADLVPGIAPVELILAHTFSGRRTIPQYLLLTGANCLSSSRSYSGEVV
jgi:hypothetical protein